MSAAAVDPDLVAFFAALDKQCPKLAPKHSVRLEVYFRNAQQLLLQGRNYMRMGEYEHAYVYLKRFAYLVLLTISKHNAYRLPRYRPQASWAKKEVDTVLGELKTLKETVKDRFAQRKADKAATSHAARAAAKERSGAGGAGAGASGRPALDAATLRAFDALRVGPSSGANNGASRATSKSYPAAVPSRQPSRRAVLSSDVHSLASGALRRVQVPMDIPEQFLRIAAPNTHKPPYGVETCGILAGVVTGPRQIKITHMIIPPQVGSSDTVAMTDQGEIDLFMYCTSNDLLALGWIHTHPSQKCFLSSVDVHTHCAYQIMMAEALAIVMAPTDPSMNCGIFHLTEPGLATVQSCEKTGFHQHPAGITIYQACAHVDLVQAPLKIVDLRK